MTLERYVDQHKKRLEWMPWLFFSLKEKQLAWALPWQREVQARLQELETVRIAEGCFVAEGAAVFAEPGRAVTIGKGSAIGTGVFLHGPVVIGEHVGINPGAVIDGGRAGVVIGSHTRIAQGVSIYAFNHGLDPGRLVRGQPVSSRGVVIGEDVWIGANASIRDGVTIGAHAVVGMGSVVTRDVPEWAIVAGNPARILGDRRHKPRGTPGPHETLIPG